MKVAVLVHNDVMSDARVRKEVRTLSSAGYTVDVYGLTNNKSRADYPRTIEGCRSFVITPYERFSSSGTIRKVAKALAFVVEMLVLLLALWIVARTVRSDNTYLQFGMLSIALSAPLWLANFAGLGGRLVKLALTAYQGVAAILLVLLLHEGFLSTGFFLVGGLLLWSSRRINVSRARVRGWAKAAVSLPISRLRPDARNMRYRYLAGLLENAASGKDYDVVHCHDVVALLAGHSMKQSRPDLKLIWDAHEIYEDLAQEDEAAGLRMRQLIRTAEGSVDRFITINESIAQVYRENYSLPEPAIIMNATVKCDAVAYDGRLHKAAGLDSSRRILLFQGGFSRRRGLNALMAAAEKLPEPWTLVLMGWGAMEAELREAAVRANEGREREARRMAIIPPAPHSELAAWTAGGELGIIPYEEFGRNHLYCSPNKLWEFPNAGVPIVATDLVEMGKMIRQWGTGFLIPRDVRSFDIIELLANVTEEEIQEKQANCRRFIEEMSWDKFEHILVDMYRDIKFSDKAADMVRR